MILWIVMIWSMIYAGFIVVIIRGLSRIHTGRSQDTPRVSVVIAARNEAAYIGRCIESVRAQDYDPGKYDVIVADDRSTDSTPSILRELAAAWQALRVIHIDCTPKGISPKKHALAQAISAASGEIILQTDADCEVPPGWISGMAGAFGPDTGFVAGIAPYRAAPGLLNSFIRHEYLWNAALAAASISLGRGTHASGRTMGFRRDIFARVGGYGETAAVLSGDDTLLLHRIRKSGLAGATVMASPATHVFTSAPATFGAFLRQRVRHMSTGRLFDPVLIVIGGIVYGFHLALMASLVLAPFSRIAFAAFGVGFFIRCTADACVARKVEKKLHLPVQWVRFIPNELFLTLYMAVMPLVSTFLPVRWKTVADDDHAGAVSVNSQGNP